MIGREETLALLEPYLGKGQPMSEEEFVKLTGLEGSFYLWYREKHWQRKIDRIMGLGGG